ncbi:ankyrin repeat and KH domain-containing protein 1-like isoform X2 [Zophobas morio]|uniref:ankyrin repeat and KH domain-containing protein 1-like isoform X2 n=1 Tax=Zophobas morio TaxID=2755281 RepID=UPI0030832DD9
MTSDNVAQKKTNFGSWDVHTIFTCIMVRALINAGSDVCKVGQTGRTPLSMAVELQNLDVVKLLVDKGASPTVQTVFIEAIQSGNIQIVKHLQEKGASINFVYEDGCTPLTKAIQTGHVKIAEFLYGQGANPEVITNDVTNLHLMNYATNGNIDMVNFLVELGVKLDVVGADGSTPLTKAVQIENFQLVKYFIEKGANVNGVDGNNKIPLGIAAENCYFSIVKFLIEFGADIELAKTELTAYCSWNKDLAIYLKLMNKEISKTVTVLGSGHDGSDLLETKVEEK